MQQVLKIGLNGNNKGEYQLGSLFNKTDGPTLSYLKVDAMNIADVFLNFKDLVEEIETARQKSQRVRDTPNNPVSSRSVLIYDFVLKFIGVEECVNFLIIDLPGKEEIEPTFIDSYLNNLKNKTMYDVIKNGFISHMKNKSESTQTTVKPSQFKTNTKVEKKDDMIKQLLNLKEEPTNEDGEHYIEYLKSLLCTMIVNPIAIPLFATDTLLNILSGDKKDEFKEIIEKELDREYILDEVIDTVKTGRKMKISGKMKLMDEIYRSDINIISLIKKYNTDTYNRLKRSIFLSYDSEEIKIGFNISFSNILTYNNTINKFDINSIYDELQDNIIDKKTNDNMIEKNLIKHNKVIEETQQWYNKYINNSLQFFSNDNFSKIDNSTFNNIPNIKSVSADSKNVEPLKKYTLTKKRIGIRNYFINANNGYSIKSDLLTHLMIRLIELEKYELIQYIYKQIIDDKINKYIEYYYTHAIKNNNELENEISKYTLINFKTAKLTKLSKYLEQNNSSDFNENKTNFLNIIKYNMYTTGLEGIYINENIIGIMKYMTKLIQKESRNIIRIEEQKDNLTIDNKYKQFKFYLTTKTKNITEYNNIKQHTRTVDTHSESNINSDGTNSKCDSNIENYFTQFDFIDNPTFDKDILQKKLINELQCYAYIETKDIAQKTNYFADKPFISDSEVKRIYNITDNTPNNRLFRIDIYKEGASEKTTYINNRKIIYNIAGLKEYYDNTLKTYESSKIFNPKRPIITSILDPYLTKICDFKIFYLLANYTKKMREHKCAQQLELLDLTADFIRMITR